MIFPARKVKYQTSNDLKIRNCEDRQTQKTPDLQTIKEMLLLFRAERNRMMSRQTDRQIILYVVHIPHYHVLANRTGNNNNYTNVDYASKLIATNLTIGSNKNKFIHIQSSSV